MRWTPVLRILMFGTRSDDEEHATKRASERGGSEASARITHSPRGPCMSQALTTDRYVVRLEQRVAGDNVIIDGGWW